MKTLRLILGDQLNIQHSWFETVSDTTVYCMFEMRQETDYVKHHIQKVVGFFAAMREFSKQLKSQGHNVIYFTLDDPSNLQNLEDNLNPIISTHNMECFHYQAPDEYRLDAQLKSFCQQLSISSLEVDTEHFYTKRDELSVFFEGKKQFLMERFYLVTLKPLVVLMKQHFHIP
jgi:deoxyribodipyrimidine photolyase-related protein